MASTAAAESPSSGPRSPNSHRSADRGTDASRRSADTADAAVSLPAITATPHRVHAARPAAPSLRGALRFFAAVLICITSEDNLCASA